MNWKRCDFGYRERVTDTHLKHIRELPLELPEIFAAAALSARVKLDLMELSFTTRTRTRWPGFERAERSKRWLRWLAENRVRLPLEVYREVRNRGGNDYVVGVRFLADEVIAGGSRVDDAIYYAKEFARAGFDFLVALEGRQV